MESPKSTWITDGCSVRCTGLLVIATLLVHAGVASADEEVKPWSRGISRDTRAHALDIFAEGNRLMGIPLFAPAAEKYAAKRAPAMYPSRRCGARVQPG